MCLRRQRQRYLCCHWLSYWCAPGIRSGPDPVFLYISPVAGLVLQYGVSLQQYADDTPLYIACSVNDAVSALSTLESCLASLHSWFCHNGLALNPSKSEAILFGTRQRLNSFPRPSVIHILSSSVPIFYYITTLLAFLTTCSSSSFLPCLSRSLTDKVLAIFVYQGQFNFRIASGGKKASSSVSES